MEKFSKVYENIAIQLIRICRFEFDFNQNAYPKWYPIVKGTRLCCHYHLHEKIEIILMDEGEAEFQVSERTYTLKKGDLLMINPFEPHSGFISNECDKAAYYVINIDLDSLKSIPLPSFRAILDELIKGTSVYYIDDYNENIKKALVECYKNIVQTVETENETMQLGYVFHFFGLLGQPVSIDEPTEKKRSPDFIKTTILYIQNTPPQDISLDSIAKRFSYNKAYFTTLFKKNFGVPFIDYVNSYKISKAREYIRNGNYNLNEVAIECGFNYYAYFFKKFKLITGVSPSDFVEQCKNNKNSQNS